MSDEDLANYKTYISDFDITKYIVLDNESNYWYSAEYIDKMLKKQDKEIERLNNIIKEVREYIKQTGQYLEDIKRFKVDVLEPDYLNLLEILDKVGSDKE